MIKAKPRRIDIYLRVEAENACDSIRLSLESPRMKLGKVIHNPVDMINKELPHPRDSD
jgi:hypothetical protein